MRMLWVCIALAIAAGATAVYFGSSVSGVLIAALLVLCCGGMLFGMRRTNGSGRSRSQHMDMPESARRKLPR